VDTQVPVVCGAVEAQIDTERDRRPGRVLCAAVKAYLKRVSPRPYNADLTDQAGGRGHLVGGFRFEFLKDFLGLRLSGTHCG